MNNIIQAGVAQLVEQLICNQQVGGSSPSTSSNFLLSARIMLLGGVPEWPKGADCKSVAFQLRWSESTLLHHESPMLLHWTFLMNLFCPGICGQTNSNCIYVRKTLQDLLQVFLCNNDFVKDKYFVFLMLKIYR